MADDAVASAPRLRESRPNAREGPKGRSAAASAQNCFLEVVAAKIKRLEEAAQETEANAKVELREAERRMKDAELSVKEAELRAKDLRAQAAERRAEAETAYLEYSRLQRDAALAQLEAVKRKKPMNPWFHFVCEVGPTVTGVTNQRERNKKLSEIWADLGDEYKQKYKDRFDEETKSYQEWAQSEGGKEILKQRNEVLNQSRADSADALVEAMASAEPGQAAAAGVSPPAKRATSAGQGSSRETPAKQRRVARARAALLPTTPDLDEEVLDLAGKADLVAPLRNLASRPEVAALNKSPQELLAALNANHGMVNAARRSLLAI